MNRLPCLLALLLALLVITACGGDEDDNKLETHKAADGSVFNDADAAFATDMVQHHALALTMVDMTQGRDLEPAVADLVEDIRQTQVVEIELMVDWLNQWDQPIPVTSRDHVNAHGHGEPEEGGDPEMPGMMSPDQRAELEAAPDADFQRLWLEMMIEHHEGAIEMAKAEQKDGVAAPAVELAESIATAQTEEITTMKDLLGS